MDVSRRERIMMIITVLVVSVLVLDRFVVSPFLQNWDEIRAQKAMLTRELDSAANLFSRGRRARRRWQQMRGSRLQEDASEAEGRVLHAVREWSQKHRLVLSSVNPEHSAGENDLREIGFRVSGTGSMRSAVGFLAEMQASDLPLRLREMQLASTREGQDEIALQLRVSTIYVPHDPGENGETGDSPADGEGVAQ